MWKKLRVHVLPGRMSPSVQDTTGFLFRTQSGDLRQPVGARRTVASCRPMTVFLDSN